MVTAGRAVPGLGGRRGRPGTAAGPGLLVAAAVAVLLEGGYVLLQPHAPDLPAQMARVSAVSRGVELWWAGWYGGINTPTYSLISAHLMNALGVPALGVIATAGVCLCGADLMRQCERPRAGSAAVAIAACANLYSGRITFSAGLALALGSLCCLRRDRHGAGLVLAALTGLVSPLAALCQAVALTALLCSGPSLRRPRLVALVLCAAPVAVLSVVFGQPSYMPFSADVCVYALLACAGVWLAPVPRTVRALALVSAALVMAAYVVHSPVGSNAARMPMLAAAPLVVATARRGSGTRGATTLALALVIWPLCSFGSDMAIAAQPSSQRGFYEPLLTRLPPLGQSIQRVEVLDPLTHGAAYYMSTQVPLARGWERQIDAAQNPLFYTGTLTPGTYRRWLVQHAVGWVAVPTTAPLDYGSLSERSLVGARLPYLRLSWTNKAWRLYRVTTPAPGATGALSVTALSDTAIDLTATGTGQGSVKVSFSRLLTVRSVIDRTVVGCVRPGMDGQSQVTVPRPGRYILNGQLRSVAARCARAASGP